MNQIKILTIGDPHGEKPILAKRLIKKYNPDFIFCTGDLAYSGKVRNVIFKNWDRIMSGEQVEDIIGRKKFVKITIEAVKSMNTILKSLNGLGKPVYLIYGNNDYAQKDLKRDKINLPGIEKQAKKYKNVKLLLASKVKLGNYNLLAVSGYRGYQSKKLKNSKLYKTFRKLFSNSKNVILMYHDVPYKTKFDVVKNKESPMNGKHVGDPIINQILKKYKPMAYVCSHMHENAGFTKIYGVPCLNAGSVQNKDYFIINIKGRNVSIKRVK